MTREQGVNLMIQHPLKVAHMLGFNKLTDMHEKWIIEMVRGKEDHTLMAHRESYKTTCVSVALAEIIILLPNYRTMFMRKTDTDVKEVIKQVQKILSDPHMAYITQCIYGVPIKLNVQSATEVSTNLTSDIRGTSQLVGIGVGGSLTGKHFDRIFTDDIINVKDRVSKAERENTKLIYQELQNIKNRGGRIFNTLTPWHKEDASTLMPNPERFDCYSTGLMDAEQIAYKKAHMTASLFAANYELKHIAGENVLFSERPTDADTGFIFNALCQIDAAFGGEDYTAFTAMAYQNGHFYIYGRCWRKHVEECYAEIAKIYNRFTLGKCLIETNADKGMVARDLKAKHGLRMVTYHESMNKHIKISAYLKAIWEYVIFVDGTDAEYIEQILDYTEDAEHDDCPDSAASLARKLYRKAKINLNIGLNDQIKEETI